MKRLVILAIAAALIAGGSLTAAAFGGKTLLISASAENFWSWRWQAPPAGEKYSLITAPAEAERLIATLPAAARAAVGAELRKVDFQRNAALVVYLGERPTAGYRAIVGQIIITPGHMQVRVGRQSPAADSVNAAVVTYPFTVHLIPREDLPEGPFSLTVQDQAGKTLHTELISLVDAGIWQWQWRNKLATPTVEVVTSAAQARRLLQSWPAAQRQATAATLQKLDYRKQVAIVAYLGPVPSLAFKIGIGAVRVTQAGIQVWLGLQSPAGPTILPAMTAPAAVTTLPKNSLSRGQAPAHLEVRDQNGNLLTKEKIDLRLAASAAATATEPVWQVLPAGA